MTIPAFVSVKDELDMDLGFADFDLSFFNNRRREEERLTEWVNKEEKAVPVMHILQVGKWTLNTEKEALW